MRALTMVVVCLLASGCGRSAPAEPDGSPSDQPPAQRSSDLALPVAAPIQARDRLLHDIDEQKKKARERNAALDGLLQQR